jgi:prevent-host-death family protein
MKRATVTEAKNGLSALLDLVKAGETILITDRGVPVAKLEPSLPSDDWDAHMARLEREGVVRRGKRKPSLEILERPPIKTIGGASVVELLLEERRTGR